MQELYVEAFRHPLSHSLDIAAIENRFLLDFDNCLTVNITSKFPYVKLDFHTLDL